MARSLILGGRLPRKVTAAADGQYRERYDLGIIRRTDLDVNVPNCDLQPDRPALALLRTPQMAASLGLATLETAETLGASRSAYLPNYVEQARLEGPSLLLQSDWLAFSSA